MQQRLAVAECCSVVGVWSHWLTWGSRFENGAPRAAGRTFRTCALCSGGPSVQRLGRCDAYVCPGRLGHSLGGQHIREHTPHVLDPVQTRGKDTGLHKIMFTL
jgi:hypothetical protein